jgi:hypothetical protein
MGNQVCYQFVVDRVRNLHFLRFEFSQSVARTFDSAKENNEPSHPRRNTLRWERAAKAPPCVNHHPTHPAKQRF